MFLTTSLHHHCRLGINPKQGDEKKKKTPFANSELNNLGDDHLSSHNKLRLKAPERSSRNDPSEDTSENFEAMEKLAQQDQTRRPPALRRTVVIHLTMP